MDDDYYIGSGKNKKKVDESKIKKDFKIYCNKKTNKIDQGN